MHPFFEPLDNRETMLLLTTMTVGTGDDGDILQFFNQERASHLQEKADALRAIAADKRVPFMVREMRLLLNRQAHRGIEKCDPSWLLHALKGENTRVVGIILATLPPATARAVHKRLPPAIRERLPSDESLQRVPRVLAHAVRQQYAQRFEAMPDAPSGRRFSFRDVIHLERKEIFLLMRDLGLIELGQAFVMVGKVALAELCRRLPRENAEELVQAVKAASRVDLPDRKSAQHFLSKVVQNFDSTEELFQKAGLWRLAKGFLAESDALRQAFRQRLPRGAARLFSEYLNKAREMGDPDEVELQHLQDSVLIRVRLLANNDVLGPRWRQVELDLHDAESARALMGDEHQDAAASPEATAE